jgi:beta-galactosidase
VLHLLPHWNWMGREGQEIGVRALSNCDEVELLLNGKSLGRQRMPRNSHLDWLVRYEPGTLSARGYSGGKEVVRAAVPTTGEAAAVRLIPDRTTIDADAEDIAVVTVAIVDHEGRIVPTAENEVSFGVSANARIIGSGNGDPANHEPEKLVPHASFRPVEGWRAKAVDSPEGRPEVAEGFSDADWPPAAPGSMDMPEQSIAVYRATADLSQADLAAGGLKLVLTQVDDRGLVYVNGQELARTDDWRRGYAFDITGLLRAGENVIAVVVENDRGPGGLGRVYLQSGARAPQWKARAFGGLCQIIVQSAQEAGPITLKADSPGLRSASSTITAAECVPRPAVP